MFDTKYRPRRFREVVGQDAVVAQLKGMVKSERIPKAILLGGPYGCGKTTLARIFARAVNCQALDQVNIEPCLKCEACRSDSEITEVNVADERGIDTMRSLVETTIYAPMYNYRVYILDEFHQATSHAQQALLKPLESAEGRALWIICTTDPGAVLPTIASRCRVMRLVRPSVKDIIKVLRRICKHEGLKLGLKELKTIAELSGGHVRDAVKALESVADALAAGHRLDGRDLRRVVESTIGRSDRQAAWKWLLAFLNAHVPGMLESLKEVDRYDLFFVHLAEAYEQALALAVGAATDEAYETLVRALRKVYAKKEPSLDHLARLGGLIGEYLTLAKRYAMDPKLAALAFSARAMSVL